MKKEWKFSPKQRSNHSIILFLCEHQLVYEKSKSWIKSLAFDFCILVLENDGSIGSYTSIMSFCWLLNIGC